MGCNEGFAAYNPSVIIGAAANIAPAGNPVFAIETFLQFYPQFTQLPPFVVQQFIGMANNFVLQSRWNDEWTFGMCLFIGHFCTLYLQSLTAPDATGGQVIAAAQTRGLQTSKGAGDLSVSYDYGELTQDLNGWGMFKSTTYGAQFATLAKSLTKGNVYIW